MNVKEICTVFETIAPVEIGTQSDRDQQRLGLRFGNPDTEVKGIGVAWYLAMDVIEQAIEKGLNFLLIHEPNLFYCSKSLHWYTCLLPTTNPVNLKKMKLLIDNTICVYTAHSNWDLQKEVGMQPVFAKALGMTDEITRDKAVGIYRIAPTPFSELTKNVKSKVGLERMRVQGDPDKTISTVAVGFGGMGAIVDAIIANNADAGIFGEINEFSFIAAREAGVGLIETTHMVSESIGFQGAADAMKEKLPDLNIEFLEIPFTFEWV